MKAVARLVWSYFMGSMLMRVLTVSGIVLVAIDFFILMTQAHSGGTIWIAIFGLIFLFVGSSSMPVILGRLASSHAIRVLPGGRLKLLVSAFAVVLLVSLPVGIVSPATFTSDMSSLSELMKNPAAREYVLQLAGISFTSAVIFASWMYVAIWFLTSKRTVQGLIGSLLVILLMMFLPTREMRDLNVSLTWNLQQIAVVWTLFGAGFLLWPRFKAGRARSVPRFDGLARALSGRTVGREFDVLLGTSNPWPVIVGLALALLLMTHSFGEDASAWLFLLTIFSVVIGANSGRLPERSKTLWLRGDWSRAVLFSAVERSAWRHNAHILGALTLVLVCIGLYTGYYATLLICGVVLLVLGSALSTYLGLALTQGLRWLEVLCGVAVMGTLMVLADFVAHANASLALVLALELGVGVIAALLRQVARRRWMQIDWMKCRAERVLVIRGA